MNKKEAVEIYRALTAIKSLTGVDTKTKIVIIRNVGKLKEVSEKFDSERNTALEMMKPEGFDEREADITKLAGKQVTPDIAELVGNHQAEKARLDHDFTSFLYGELNKETGKRTGGLLNEDAGVEIEKITKEAFEKIVEANEEVDVDKLSVLLKIVG